MNKIKLNFVPVVLFVSAISISGQSLYNVSRKFQVPGDGFWDYIAVDESHNRVFASHNTVVQAVDLKSGSLAGTIQDTKGVHGMAFVPDLNKGFTSNGRDSSVTVFNLTTLETTNVIRVTGKNPDAILYDAFSGNVYTGNGRSSSFTVISAKTEKVVATIPLAGKPEAIVTDGKGKIYVNIEDKSTIQVIDAKALKVVNEFSVSPGEEPSGLAMDVTNNRLFSVCSNKLMIVLDAASGKVITTLPIGDRCDGAAFDPTLKRAYSSNGEGNLTVVQELTPDSYKVLETVPTQAGARTIALDKTSHKIYLPTAEFEAAAGDNRRPSVKAGSFTILEVEAKK